MLNAVGLRNLRSAGCGVLFHIHSVGTGLAGGRNEDIRGCIQLVEGDDVDAPPIIITKRGVGDNKEIMCRGVVTKFVKGLRRSAPRWISIISCFLSQICTLQSLQNSERLIAYTVWPGIEIL